MKKTIYQSTLIVIAVLLTTGYSLKAQSAVKDTIYSMSPTSGSLGGNTLVTLTGQGFKDSLFLAAFFSNNAIPGGMQMTNLKYVSDSVMTFRTIAWSSVDTFSVYLEVDSNGQHIVCPIKFEYKLPEITELQPDISSAAGNDTITISGNYFYGASYVKFGAAGDTVLTVTDTSITVLSPAQLPGKVSVQVQVQGQYSSISGAPQFTYESDEPDSVYVLSLKDSTGLPEKYKVYILGYSTNSQKMLTVSADSVGSFTPMPTTPDSGYVESYELGKDITSITLSSLNPIVGARIYFFIADTTVTYADSSDQTANSNLGFKYTASGANVFQVENPPQSNYPQYSYIEATFEANQGLFIDISTVDGFFFPMSILAQDSTGVELDRIGQPSAISADDIVNAYGPFMSNLAIAEPPAAYYSSLAYVVNPDLTALLNPGLYLETNTSMLETVFDSALTVLYTDTSLKMKIWQNGDSTFQAYYDVAPSPNQIFPGTTNTHDALAFTNDTSETMYLFNPVGFSVVSYLNSAGTARNPIMGTILDSVLTFETPLPINVGLDSGMYVSSGGGSTDGTTQIISIKDSSNKIVSVTLNSANNYPIPFQYMFAKAPTNYYFSSGQMTFAGIGLFADGTYRPGDPNTQTVVNGLENQISTALNRGVGLQTYADTTSAGCTTKNWAKETYWYPQGQPQNYFSYFMHTAVSDTQTIFTLPQDSVKSARGAYMSRAYGFAYDENPSPLGGYTGPQVPSEFPGVFPKNTTQLLLVLGPWNEQ